MKSTTDKTLALIDALELCASWFANRSANARNFLTVEEMRDAIRQALDDARKD